MFARLAAVLVARRKRILVLALFGLVVAGAIGGNVAQHLSQGGFEDPSAESVKAEDILEDVFHQGDPNILLLVTAPPGKTVDDPAVARIGNDLTAELGGEQGVGQAVSYWSLGSPAPLKSSKGALKDRQALVLARIDGTQDEQRDVADVLGPKYARTIDGVTVRVGGFSEIFRQVGTQIEKDLARAESIAFPITLILLILVFGSVVAAALPLAIGVLAIIGTFLALRVVASFTEVSIFSLNLTTAMGLGLAIDYSLFIVSRYREEMRKGYQPFESVIRTVQTAGRTVAFSALTVAVSLAALLIFPLAFLRSFAYAGIAVVLLAAVGAVIVLPALLAVLGRNVDKWVLWRRQPKQVGEGFWHRIAMSVMKRPVPIATAAVLVLVFLGLPFFAIQFRNPDDRVLPTSASSRQVQEDIRTGFNSQESLAISVVARNVDPVARSADIDRYATALSKLKNVSRVDATTGFYLDGKKLPPQALNQRFATGDNTYLSVVPSHEPLSNEGEALVKAVRATPAPFPVLVGGAAAGLVDQKASLFATMPWAILLIATFTFVLLFLMFGSVVVPAKALVLNVLSLSATFGAMVWIFQDGHFSNALNFTATGALDSTTPILMFCVAFGLSMDYEVFLLSRIKEEHDATHDNVHSVAVGLEHTGRIVTAAAALLSVVFLAFATSHITFIKLFGIGLTMAVLMDATVIRATLVPAFMRLAGEANWWAPPFLRRVYDRFGIHEVVDLDEAPAAYTPAEPVGADR